MNNPLQANRDASTYQPAAQAKDEAWIRVEISGEFFVNAFPQGTRNKAVIKMITYMSGKAKTSMSFGPVSFTIRTAADVAQVETPDSYGEDA